MTNKPWFQVLKALGLMAMLTIFWLIIFAALEPDPNEMDYEPFSGASVVLAIVTYCVISFIMQYTKVINFKEEINSSFYAISIKEDHVKQLLTQLQDVTDKMMDHELKMSVKQTFSELVEEEKNSDHATSDGTDNQHYQTKKKLSNQSTSLGHHENISQVSEKVTKLVERIERDTKGTANHSLEALMAEIKEATAMVTNQRLYHNETVSRYNRSIYALPLAFFRKIFGFTEQPYM
ncbi:LemA family protein [Streptococcus caprae]|uniref:LemA family protein n=1 Tax=Streptococcus caprae TaxID=1640501 RepID=A0ABV8CTT2_9STRE